MRECFAGTSTTATLDRAKQTEKSLTLPLRQGGGWVHERKLQRLRHQSRPAPGSVGGFPGVYRGIYGMPMFVTLPTRDLEASVDFWTRGLGFIDLFTIPGQLTMCAGGRSRTPCWFPPGTRQRRVPAR